MSGGRLSTCAWSSASGPTGRVHYNWKSMFCCAVFFLFLFCLWACEGKHPECVQAEASPRNTFEHFCIEHIECIIIGSVCFVVLSLKKMLLVGMWREASRMCSGRGVSTQYPRTLLHWAYRVHSFFALGHPLLCVNVVMCCALASRGKHP